MCKAFSCLVNREGEVFWQAGMDTHDRLVSLSGWPDTDTQRDWARAEIVPTEGYLYPEKPWGFHLDEEVEPSWWSEDHRLAAEDAHRVWKEEVYGKINLEEARNPINPLALPPVKAVTEEHLAWLRAWGRVREGVWANVGDGVEASVGASVGAGVLGLMVGGGVVAVVDPGAVGSWLWGDFFDLGVSVRESVSDSIWAYCGSLFDIWPEGYPYQCAVNLWHAGLIPSWDGNSWQLHTGPDAHMIWQGASQMFAEL